MSNEAKTKLMLLRIMATQKSNLQHEPLRVFKEIEKDPQCNKLLRNSELAEENAKMKKRYNLHILRSNLSAKEKRSLLL